MHQYIHSKANSCTAPCLAVTLCEEFAETGRAPEELVRVERELRGLALTAIPPTDPAPQDGANIAVYAAHAAIRYAIGVAGGNVSLRDAVASRRKLFWLGERTDPAALHAEVRIARHNSNMNPATFNHATLSRKPHATDFALALEQTWAVESIGKRYEVPLFRALIRSFRNLPSHFHVEEYHGNKHQVRFKGSAQSPWHPAPGSTLRCELSDLCIVTFRRSPSEIRLTYLQAKQVADRELVKCAMHPNWKVKKKHLPHFRANLKQCDLLARRPEVLGVGNFDLPSNALRDAVLPSVGSYGVFHTIGNRPPAFLYATADTLTRRSASSLSTSHTAPIRTINGYTEASMACCMFSFGACLHSLLIGTPISVDGTVSDTDAVHRQRMRAWFVSALGATSSGNPGPVAAGLIDVLTSDDAPLREEWDLEDANLPTLLLIEVPSDAEA